MIDLSEGFGVTERILQIFNWIPKSDLSCNRYFLQEGTRLAKKYRIPPKIASNPLPVVRRNMGGFCLSGDWVVYEQEGCYTGNQYAGQTNEIKTTIVIISMMTFYKIG